MNFRKYITIYALLMGLATIGRGQSPVTINGTISDAGGNPATSGTVVFDIQPQSSSIHYYVPGITTLAPQEVTCNITSSGTLQNALNAGPCVVWGNDLISPSNTTYNVTFNPNGTNTNQIAQECIGTPGPYNIDNPVFCPIVSIIPQYSMITAPVIQGNVIPSTNGVFTLGNAQAFYANGFFRTLTFLPSANGFLLATAGAVSFTNTLPGGPFCALAGCTMTGQITLPGGGTGNNAATVNQINAIAGAFLPLAGGTLTGALFGTSASFSGNMQVVSGAYFIGGHTLGAADLSNGISGTGAICLASGSACNSGGTVTSVGLSSSNATLISVSGSPVAGSGTLAMTINALGSDSHFVLANSSGASGKAAVWDATGGLTAGNTTIVANYAGTSCALVSFGSTDQNCTGTGTWSQAITGSYNIVCTIFVTPPGGTDATGLTQTFLTVSPTHTATTFQYNIANIHNASAGLTVGIQCEAFQ